MLSVNIISLKNGEVMEGKPCFTWAGKNYKAGGVSLEPLTCGRESGALGRTDMRLVLLIENVELREPWVAAPPSPVSPVPAKDLGPGTVLFSIPQL